MGGEHAEWDKQTNFVIAHRAPFMLRVPGVNGPPVTEKMIEFVDILPTLVEAAGFPPVDKCPVYSRNVTFCREGVSVMPILGGWGEVHDWGELYDLEADPQENFNLYRDHDYLQL